MYISTSEAQRMLAAAQARAQAMGKNVSISVVDGRGDLLAMVRLDKAPWRTVGISRGKAFAAAAFGVSSAELAGRAGTPPMQAMMLSTRGELVPAQGALPVMRDGGVAGAVGVSGAAPQEDEEIAAAGIAGLHA